MKRPVSRAAKRVGIVVVIAAALAIIGGAFLRSGQSDLVAAHPPLAPPAKNPDVVRVATGQMGQFKIVKVELARFPVLKTGIGQIAFNEDASTIVLTPFSGRVIRVIAKVGDVVKRGDPLFEIDSPEIVQMQTDLIGAVQAHEKSKLQLALSKRILERQTRLFADKATSQRELDQSSSDHAAAESDVRTGESVLVGARKRLRVLAGRSEAEVEKVERERLINPSIMVNSPIDGTVVSRRIGPGQYVRTDSPEPLYSLSDLSQMWLRANVPENDISDIRVGQEIEVRITALPDRLFKAHIVTVGAASDPTTRRVVVRSEIENPNGLLKSDMFATFKIITDSGEPMTAVPVGAVVREGEETSVWVEKEPLVFERRRVRVGAERNGLLQIRDGLTPDDRVVSQGAIFLDNEWHK